MKSGSITITGIFFLLLLQLNTLAQEEKSEVPVTKNIILMIGDGMGVAQVYAGITANKGKLNLMDFPVTGFSMTSSASDYITDSGAGGTAISTGYKTYDHAIGVDADTIARPTILEYAEQNGKSTGLVVTSQVNHATPASFIAHQKDRYMYEEIANDFLKTDIDVFIGGGLKYFNHRKDERNLLEDLEKKNYHVVYTLDDLLKINNGKIAGLLYEDKPPRFSNGRGNMLPLATEQTIDILNQNKTGFFMMVEGSQIDWGGHENETNYIIEEMLDFDRAVGIALEFAKKDGHTLVIVTADHETGGMALVGGDIKSGKVVADYATTDHTGVMVPVFAYGPGAEEFKGIYENTALFKKMMEVFGFRVRQNP